mmetsp:Transcript_11205/g.38160  ORF Transcript_11205/g.38160 Transcript_11205/m.38160 type:complete len:122 (-) Transcript_11205:55-420(-)
MFRNTNFFKSSMLNLNPSAMAHNLLKAGEQICYGITATSVHDHGAVLCQLNGASRVDSTVEDRTDPEMNHCRVKSKHCTSGGKEIFDENLNPDCPHSKGEDNLSRQLVELGSRRQRMVEPE